jgi:hypothetical protein
VLYRHGVDPSDEKQHGDLNKWMLDKMERFRRVFGPRVKALPLSSASEAGDYGTAEE